MAPGREITVTAVKGQSKRRADPTFFLIPTPAAVYKGEPTPRSKRAAQGRLAVEREIRPLLRDYVEILLLTGIRHGTEEMGLYWNHLEWHEQERKKYLRLWVAGKTGGRWPIAKHRAVAYWTGLTVAEGLRNIAMAIRFRSLSILTILHRLPIDVGPS